MIISHAFVFYFSFVFWLKNATSSTKFLSSGFPSCAKRNTVAGDRVGCTCRLICVCNVCSIFVLFRSGTFSFSCLYVLHCLSLWFCIVSHDFSLFFPTHSRFFTLSSSNLPFAKLSLNNLCTKFYMQCRAPDSRFKTSLIC